MALERRLAVKTVFQRHARGYKTTRRAKLLRVARPPTISSASWRGPVKGRGEAVRASWLVTSLMELSSWMTPVFGAVPEEEPDVTRRRFDRKASVRWSTVEAHIAIRAGTRCPDSQINVVQPFICCDGAVSPIRAISLRMGCLRPLMTMEPTGLSGMNDAQMRAPFL